jgi:hypothetical protein
MRFNKDTQDTQDTQDILESGKCFLGQQDYFPTSTPIQLGDTTLSDSREQENPDYSSLPEKTIH